ncbi:ribonucleotide reductase N-terminal alpha domain-containing protein [Sporosarcina sp. P33]|uniref:ribonucleotide reductase N-terminal alpha domain-containing protein n=1 Tax=Sporosarcina sp. P33 TaxID=1930764 RepID=UPI0009BFD16A|nr:ribonucleotide reductase N-terminal alpha domain-containing protein [Sporosarcina sp. P33]ARD48250.1 hypothetical protein SporoP33_08430 [Sporosarcina sp. P33]
MRAIEQTIEHTQHYTLLDVLYKQAEQQRGRPVYQGFHRIVRRLLQEGLYGQWIHSYSVSEIKWLGLQIKAERDQLLSAVQIRQYMNEFITSNYYDQRVGLPQERLMLIAMAAMQNETAHRLQKVKEAYWVLSSGYLTLPAEIMSFFGKNFHRQHPARKPYSMDVTDSRVPSFLASKVKEKHIHIPDYFMEQVQACGSWIVYDRELMQRVFGCSHLDPNSAKFHQATKRSSPAYKKVSAIGLMKQLLASENIILHFDWAGRPEMEGLSSYIQLPILMQSADLARVSSALVRLLNGIERVSGHHLQIEIAGWETAIRNQGLDIYSNAALLFIDEISEELNGYLKNASRQSGLPLPLRKASAVLNQSAAAATLLEQRKMIDRVRAEQRHTDQGGSVTLQKSAVIETAELLQLLMKAWKDGIPEVQII